MDSTLSRISQLWNVDTDDVKERIRLVFTPLSPVRFVAVNTLEAPPGTVLRGKQADIYGPLWIFVTLVFTIFFATTMLGTIVASALNVKYDLSLDVLVVAVNMQLLFTLLIPVVNFVLLNYFDIASVTLMQMICLHGYANAGWLPFVLVAGSPLGSQVLFGRTFSFVIQAVFVALGAVVSGVFELRTLGGLIFDQSQGESNRGKKLLAITVGMAMHLGFALTMWFTLYGASKGMEEDLPPA